MNIYIYIYIYIYVCNMYIYTSDRAIISILIYMYRYIGLGPKPGPWPGSGIPVCGGRWGEARPSVGTLGGRGGGIGRHGHLWVDTVVVIENQL